MSDDARSRTTQLVRNLVDGRPGAARELLPLVYDELHRMARGMLGPGSNTLGPTALIHEAWLRLIDPDARDWGGREHFVRVGAKAMRYVMLDHARARSREKRGEPGGRVTGSSWSEVRALFEEVIDRDHDERDALLRSAAPELRGEVQAPLASDATGDGAALDRGVPASLWN